MTEASETTDEPRRGSRRAPVLILLGVAVALVVAMFSYAAVINNTVTSNLNRGASMPPPPTPTTGSEEQPEPGDPADPSKEPAKQNRSVNFVLMGSDSRDANNAGAGRSDALMVVHLNSDRTKAYIISFPRDMWVNIPGHGQAKINAAYAYGGTALTVQTLQELLTVQMHHLVVMDFDGFIALTDELGGVTVHNEHAFSSGGYSFPEGEITISGEEALAFVRERKSLPNGDFDRAKNQRKVIKAIMEKGLSPEVIANPGKFTAFIGGVARHTTVDNGMTDDRIRELALSLRLRPSGIVLMQAPIKGLATSADGQSIDVVDERRLAELAEALQNDDVESYVQRYPED